jgi:hypothetical protein
MWHGILYIALSAAVEEAGLCQESLRHHEGLPVTKASMPCCSDSSLMAAA